MKKIIALILLSVSMAWSADTYTTNAGIRKPETGANDVWGVKLNNNFDIIDSSFAVLGGSQTFTGSPTFSSATVTTIRSEQVIIATPTYSGGFDLYVNGSGVIGTLNVGGSGLFGPPYINFSNGGAGTGMQIYHDGSVNGGMLLRALNGIWAVNPSNSPVVLGAKRLFVGEDYYSSSTQLVGSGGNDNESVIQGPVWIGTHTVSGTPKVAILGDTTSSYSLLVSTTVTISSTTFQVGITTTGAVSFHGMTAAQIRTTKPNKVGEEWYCTDCATVTKCVSTGTVVGQVSAISSKATACN